MNEDDGPFCFCGHLGDRHQDDGEGRVICYGCRDDEYATAPMYHSYEEVQ